MENQVALSEFLEESYFLQDCCSRLRNRDLPCLEREIQNKFQEFQLISQCFQLKNPRVLDFSNHDYSLSKWEEDCLASRKYFPSFIAHFLRMCCPKCDEIDVLGLRGKDLKTGGLQGWPL